MNALALFAIGFAACMAAAVATHRWVIRPAAQRERAARARRQRADRIEDVNQRLRRTPRAVRLDDIAHLDQQLADLDRYAQTIQPLYVQEGDR